MKIKNWGLKNQAVVLAIALGTLPVLTIGAVGYSLANRSLTDKVFQTKKSDAIAIADKVNSFMFERYGDIQNLANDPIFADSRISQTASVQQKQAALKRYLQIYKFYSKFTVIDLKGKPIVYVPEKTNSDFSKIDYFQKVIKTDRPVITNPRKSLTTGEWSIFVAAPIKDVSTHKTIAVIRSSMPVKYLADKIKSFESGNEQYNVIDTSGKFFIAHNPEEVGKEAQRQYTIFTQLQGEKQVDAVVALSQKGTTEKLVVFAPTQDIPGMPNLKWTLLLDVDTATAFKTQRELLVTLLIGTVLTALIVSTGAAILANRIANSLNNIINLVASSSNEIATTVEQQERTTTEQAASFNQITSTIAKLNANSKATASQAEAAAATAQQILALVDSSRGNPKWVAPEAIESSLRDKVGQIAQQLTHLGEQVGQISQISNLVSDLATQTNMLALNAALEAARAGSQGKSFGVIAAEIRKLADKSRKSAEKINLLVADIQNATNSSMIVTDEGSKTVETIVASINDIALTSTQISLNAKQQAVAVGQVMEAMNTLNRAAKLSADGISQTKSITQRLARAALDLKDMV